MIFFGAGIVFKGWKCQFIITQFIERIWSLLAKWGCWNTAYLVIISVVFCHKLTCIMIIKLKFNRFYRVDNGKPLRILFNLFFIFLCLFQEIVRVLFVDFYVCPPHDAITSLLVIDRDIYFFKLYCRIPILFQINFPKIFGAFGSRFFTFGSVLFCEIGKVP